MKNFAVIDNDNTIVNLIVAESIELAENHTGLKCVEYDIDAQCLDLSWSYDGEVFVPGPEIEQVPLEDPIINDEPSEPGKTRPE
jgi:hypothetical protein